MSRAVVPIVNMNRRLATLGRLRMGVKVPVIRDGKQAMKNGKPVDRPKSIDHWRLTSHDRDVLGQVAAIYGGEVVPWVEPKADPDQFELITGSNELRVVLPPDPLGGSPLYEMWSGGGCERRCDGETCTRMVRGPDGTEPADVACLCANEGALACEPYTRLNVILPEVKFGGVWMLASKGWDAAQELPGMVALLAQMQGRGLTEGVLRLEHRRKVVGGETRNFPVPVLALAESMDVLAAGGARYGVGAGSSAPELMSGGAEPPQQEDVQQPQGDAPGSVLGSTARCAGTEAPPANSDDDIVDAEIVDERTLADVIPADVTDAQALAAAKYVAKHKGMPAPTTLAEVTDPAFCALVLDQLGLVGQ
jgi:hypothetical protein